MIPPVFILVNYKINYSKKNLEDLPSRKKKDSINH